MTNPPDIITLVLAGDRGQFVTRRLYPLRESLRRELVTLLFVAVLEAPKLFVFSSGFFAKTN